MTEKLGLRVSEGKSVILAIAGAMAAFAIVVVFISGGFVRGTTIFLQEETQDTLAFENIGGKTALVGIVGVGGINPTLTMRTGDYAMVMTVINQDSRPHGLYVDGANASTGIIEPGQNATTTFHSHGEATYNYYEISSHSQLGSIIAVKVSPYE